jgi:predicted HicB family RNase H-like nuclease
MNTLSYKGYHGHFQYDPQADLFHGEVLHLADVVTFQGRSIDELRQALADSVEDYLEFCAQKGRPPEKPYSGRFNVRLDPGLHQRIAVLAAADGKSLNNWVADALSQAVATPRGDQA